MENKNVLNSANENEKMVKVVVNGKDLPISNRHTIAICKVLKNHSINESITMLEEIIKQKWGLDKNTGKLKKSAYGVKHPVSTAKVILKMLKSLSANANAKGLDTSSVLVLGKADKATTPQRPGSRFIKFKRTHLILEGMAEKADNAQDKTKEKKQK